MTGQVGTCIEYFSLPIDTYVGDCNGGVSKLCKTAQCTKLPKFSLLGKCKVATVSLSSLPSPCKSNLDCKGTDGVSFFTGTCSCGYNLNKTAFCAPFDGDLPGLNYYNSWKSALNASKTVCNTLKRFKESCIDQVGFGNRILQVTWEFLYYSKIQNNDQCVKEVLTDAYYGENHAGWIVLTGVLAYLM
jgi:hypothetical protein